MGVSISTSTCDGDGPIKAVVRFHATFETGAFATVRFAIAQGAGEATLFTDDPAGLAAELERAAAELRRGGAVTMTALAPATEAA